MKSDKLFISHASKDKPLVDKFVDLVLDNGCGFNRDGIYYTSDRDMGTQEGSNFIQHIKENLQPAPLVIFMLSRNFYNSKFCVGEIGATWVLDTQVFPIVIPKLQIKEIKDLFAVTQMGEISDKSYLDRLKDTIVDVYKLKHPKTATWNIKSDQFVQQLPTIIEKLPEPSIVSSTTHNELKDSYEAALQEISLKEQEIEKLKSINQELGLLKDSRDVQNIYRKNDDAQTQFENFTQFLKACLKEMPYIVRKVLYREYIDDYISPSHGYESSQTEWENVQEAKRKQYIKEHPYDDSIFLTNNLSPKIIKTWDALNQLENFLNEQDSDSNFVQMFESEHEIRFEDCLRNETFWDRFFF